MQITQEMKQIEYNKREYLERYTLNKARMKALESDLEFWENYAENTAVKLKPIMVSSSGETSCRMEQGAVNAVEIRDKIKKELQQCARERTKVVDTISCVAVPHYRVVLEMIYLSGMSIDQLAGEFGKSYNGMLKVYHQAMSKVRLPEEREEK